MSKKIAMVTGANRGIGAEVAAELAEKGLKVYLTARNIEKGTERANQLKSKGFDVVFLQMDISNQESIKAAAVQFGQMETKLDVIVNNAGIMLPCKNILELGREELVNTLDTNTFGPLFVCQAFQQFLSNEARIINISSGLGQLNDMEGEWPAYSISKTALNAVTRQLSSKLNNRKVAVNSVCPGWVQTDMGGAGATRPVSKGAETIVWLATESPIELTGKFLRDKKEIDW